MVQYCRVDIFSTHSLFGINTLLESSSFKFKKYCDCSTETLQNENSIANHHTANCSLTTQAIMCNGAFASQSLPSRCESNQNRFKREGIVMNFENHVEKRSIESDDIIEVPPLTLNPSFDPDFIPPVIVNYLFIFMLLLQYIKVKIFPIYQNNIIL